LVACEAEGVGEIAEALGLGLLAWGYFWHAELII